MLASEFIERLQELIRVHGDKPVTIDSESGFSEFLEAACVEAQPCTKESGQDNAWVIQDSPNDDIVFNVW